MPRNISEIYAILREFTSDPERMGHNWRDLSESPRNLFHSLLEDFVRGVQDGEPLDSMSYPCYRAIDNPELRRALQMYYETRSSVPVDVDRLILNMKAMLATAVAAAFTLRLAKTRSGRDTLSTKQAKDDEDAFATWVKYSATAIPERSTLPNKGTRPATIENPTDPAWLAQSEFQEWSARTGGASAIQPLFWTLYWLNRTQTLESGRRIRVPVAAADTRTGSGAIAHLELIRLADSETAELCEHPAGALLPFGRTLLLGVHAAWRTSAVQSVAWHLRGITSPQDGDSLGGAAAVAFRKLAPPGEAYVTSYLVIARLGADGRLLPAGFPKDKLKAARAFGIAKAVLAVQEDGSSSVSDIDRNELLYEGIDVLDARSVEEACVLTRGFGTGGIERMPDKLLGRYSPGRELPAVHGVRRWLGTDPRNSPVLIKLWPLNEEDRVRRTLWDRELRILYRISSSATAEQNLVVLKDAGVDRRNGCFVMVLEAPGYTTLAECLGRRNEHLWLTMDGQSQTSTRRDLWEALTRLAEGLELLHRQNLVHWNVLPENVFLSESIGFESWRLGGFEWSARFGGDVSGGEPPGSWHLPPESTDAEERAIRLDDDWYAFGTLAARCFLRIENLGNHPPSVLNRLVFEHLAQDPAPLQPLEADFLRDLIHPSAADRLRFAPDVFRHLQSIREALKEDAPVSNTARPLVLRFNPRNAELFNACAAAGFKPKGLRPVPPSEGRPGEMRLVETLYNPEDIDNVRQLREWLIDNFRTRSIHAGQGDKRDQYLLVGRRVHLVLSPYEDPIRAIRANWSEAFAVVARQLTEARGQRDLQDIPLQIVQLNEPSPRETLNWEPLLPMRAMPASVTRDLKQFWDFLRCTNQIELNFRRTEIFPYRMLPSPVQDRAFDHIRVTFDVTRLDPDLKRYLRSEGNFIEYFQRERESGKKGWNQVILSEEGYMLHRIIEEHAWEITAVEDKANYLELKRRKAGKRPVPPASGFLRSFNFKGQVRLFERRKQAIDRFGDHTYLLKALCATGWVGIDTGETGLPQLLDENVVDISKSAIMEDILRTRPIYALLGPPGTGKSTLVAHLLRQILTDDPVAQILVTAQAHGAVDVLLEKVVKEAFGDVVPRDRPITIRLGLDEELLDETIPPSQDQNRAKLIEATVERRAKSFLEEQILPALCGLTALHPLQQQWKQMAQEMLRGATTGNSTEFAEFAQLVKKGAHIIFSTTSSGDLEGLAKGEQLFDWVVVEEAGKVHGFDLALPLQAGHRWILLGDHKQLSPYRDDDFKVAIQQMDDVVRMLGNVSGPDRQLIDHEWLRFWSEHPAKDEFKEYAQRWLRSFKEIYDNACNSRAGAFTTTRSIGALAGMLSMQYRMHPAIGTLISDSFYRRQIVNMTSDELLHRFNQPEWLRGKALVWLNTPWCRREARFAENASPRYTNEMEIAAIFEFLRSLYLTSVPAKTQKVAVLSPYNRQTQKLNISFRNQGLKLCDGLGFRESLFGRRTSLSGTRLAHTVDSFQGNQADIVVVSLTRNNLAKAPLDPTRDRQEAHGLGFLERTERLNVMLSRAERLLVLVGSWEFFEAQLHGKSLEDDPDSYLWPWKKLMQMFLDFEKDGLAVRRDWEPAE